jgi:acid phosphatase
MHPTQPNYVAILGGSTFTCNSNQNCNLNYPTLVDLLEAKGVSWAYYGEDYTQGSNGACNTGWNRRNMCPQLSYTTVTESAARCQYLYSDYQLIYDIGNNTMKEFTIWSPNNQHNGHDNGYASAGAYLETWMNAYYYPYLDTVWADTLFLITWDEDAGEENNRILTFMKHPCIGSSYSDVKFNHYSLTRMIEDNWDTGNLGQNDVDAYNFASVIPENKSCVVKGGKGGKSSGGGSRNGTKVDKDDEEIRWDLIISPHYQTKQYQSLKNFGISALVIVIFAVLILATWAYFKHPPRRKPIGHALIETALVDATTFSQHKPQDDYQFYEEDETYV